MRRIDRAMYAFFLLALLGDVARSQVRLPVDTAGRFVSHAAGQYRVEALGEVGAGVRRSGGVLRPGFRSGGFQAIERIKSYSLSLIRWAWSLSAAAHADSTAAAVLDSVAFEFSAGLCALAISLLLFGSSWTVFEHLGSPAP